MFCRSMRITELTSITSITKITSSSYYSVQGMSYRGLDGRRRMDMAYYQQTLIIPKPTQRFNERDSRRRPAGRGSRNVNTNSGINSILAYFD